MGLPGVKVFGIFFTISCVAAQPRPPSRGFTVPSFTDIMRDVTQLEAAVNNFENGAQQSSGGSGNMGMPLGGAIMPQDGFGAGIQLGGASFPQDGLLVPAGGAGIPLGGAPFPQDGLLGPAVTIPSAGDPLANPSTNMNINGNPINPAPGNAVNPAVGFDIHGNPVGSPALDSSVIQGPSGVPANVAPPGVSPIDNLINELGASGLDMFGQGTNPLGNPNDSINGPSATLPGTGPIPSVDIAGAAGNNVNAIGPSTVPLAPGIFHGTNVHSSEQPVDPNVFVDLNQNVAVPAGLGGAGSVDQTNIINAGTDLPGNLPVLPSEFGADSTMLGAATNMDGTTGLGTSPQDGFVTDPSLFGPLPPLGGGPSDGFLGDPSISNSGGILGGAQIDTPGSQIDSGSLLPGGGMLPPGVLTPVDVSSGLPTVPLDLPHGESSEGHHTGGAHVDMPGEHGNTFDFPIVHRTGGSHDATHAHDASHVDTALPGSQPAMPPFQPVNPQINRPAADHMHLPTDPLSEVAATPTTHEHGSAHVDMPNEHGNPFDFPIVHRTNGSHSHAENGHSGLPAALPGIPATLPGSISPLVPTPHNDAGHIEPHVDQPGQHGNTLTEPSLHLPSGMSVSDLTPAQLEQLRLTGSVGANLRPSQPPIVPTGPSHVDTHGPGEAHIDQPGQHGNTNSEASLHLPPGVSLSDLTPAQLARLGLGNQNAQGPSIQGPLPHPSTVETGLGHREPTHGHDHSSDSLGAGDIHIDQPGTHGNTLSEAAVHLPPGMTIADLTPAQLARLGISSRGPTPTPSDLSPPFSGPGLLGPANPSPPFGGPGLLGPANPTPPFGGPGLLGPANPSPPFGNAGVGLPDWRDRRRGGMMPGGRVETGVFPGTENVPIPNERRRLRQWLRRLRNRRNRRRRIHLHRTTTTTTTTTPAPPRQIGIVIRRNRPGLNVGGLLSSVLRTATQIGQSNRGGGGLLGSLLNSAGQARPGRPFGPPFGPAVSFGGPPRNNFGGMLSSLLG